MANEGIHAEDFEEEEEDVEPSEEEEPFRPRRRQERDTAGTAPRRRGFGGRFRPRRKVCSFCVDKVEDINYKDVDTLQRFLDGHARIIPRRKTGTCAKHQRRLAVAIKQARHLALVPFTARRTPYSWR